MKNIKNIKYNIQLVKILVSINEKPLPIASCCGDSISKKTDINSATLYQILAELEKIGVVKRSNLINKDTNRFKKPYELTRIGKELSKLAVKIYFLIHELEEKTESLMGKK